MSKTAIFLCLLGLLAAGPASAHPTRAAWPFWLGKPERHGSRKLPGDYTHINKTYRNHSRSNESSGFFGFLHPGSRHAATARHKGRPHVRKSGHKHTAGIF